MTHTYQDGKIVVKAKLYEKVTYNVSNACMSAIFDGKGATVSYALANEKDFFNEGYLSICKNGTPIDVYTEKTVEMLGRCQTIYVHLEDATLIITQFLHPVKNGVFVFYELQSQKPQNEVELGITIRTPEFVFCGDGPFRREQENTAVYATLTGEKPFCTFFSFGPDAEETAKGVQKDFYKYKLDMEEEIAAVRVPEGLSQEQKALFYSSYFCALQNYKEKGDYKAFMAGHHYLLPMRSYYRDSYYTVLPMYNGHTDKVKQQILTLANGISPNGHCPSAVKCDYSQWWGNHYDSPSFFVIMLYDYVRFTKDLEILSCEVKGGTVLEMAERALQVLSTQADETGLLYKEGAYNKRDWADEVNRSGYVTYNEVLYARAFFSLGKIWELCGQPQKAASYLEQYEKIKEAINILLWDEEKGYYVNYRSREYTERNLSVDTVFAAIFHIAEEDRAIRMLKNMERLLESRNNTEQKAGDFGVLCVYPFYSKVDASCYKSSQPYYYHNGANWPYWSAMYAYAKRKYGMEYRYALESWFDYNVERGNYTPVEYFSPPQGQGSLLQAWSGVAAFVLDEGLSVHFW